MKSCTRANLSAHFKIVLSIHVSLSEKPEKVLLPPFLSEDEKALVGFAFHLKLYVTLL